jgi:HlyD family secretion protein
MSNIRQIIALMSVMGLCTACFPTGQKPPQAGVAQAAPVTAVVALGRLEPEGEVIKLSVPNAQDSRVNRLLVKEGDRVQTNQIIAVLQGIDRREADLRDAEADVRLRSAELTKVQQGDAKKAQLAAQSATIARLEAQLDTQLQQRRAAIANAAAVLKNAHQTYQRRRSLYQAGGIPRADLDTAQRELETAQATLTERQADLAQSDRTLRAEITQEQARRSEMKEVRPIDVEIAQAQLEKAKIAIVQRRANLEDVQVRSPVNGQILRINTRVGEQVNTAQGIMEIAKTDRMFATAEVSENDIGKIKRGQSAAIASEYSGFSGEIQGVVEHVGLQIGRRTQQEAGASGGTTGSPTMDQNARVVIVKIRINKKDNAKVAAFTNMQVRVKINTSENNASS